jgi:transcriptional regulator with XRE-family HTH domain
MPDYWNDRLKHFRETAGMTQAELSTKSGVSQSLITNLEKGKRNFTQKSLSDILRVLGRDYHDLFIKDKQEATDPATTVPKTQETTQDNSPATETSSDNKMAAREAFYYVLKEGDDNDIALLRLSIEESKRGIESKKKQDLQQHQMDKVLPRAA